MRHLPNCGALALILSLFFSLALTGPAPAQGLGSLFDGQALSGGEGGAVSDSSTASADASNNGQAADPVPAAPRSGVINGTAPTLSDADFAEWERVVTRAEAAIAAGRASDAALGDLRTELADWRARFLAAQGDSANTIQTLEDQIAALGPAPEEGTAEPDELARQREALNSRLAEVQAPVKAAEVAYSRAEGLIRGVDRVLRTRQTGKLISLGPSPLNPVNWAEAASALLGSGRGLWSELNGALQNPVRRQAALDNLPRSLFFLGLAVIILLRGRHWMELLVQRVQVRRSAGRWLVSFLLSLGLIAVPLIGLNLLVIAADVSGLAGLRGDRLLSILPEAGLSFLIALWLGGRCFPKSDAFEPLFDLSTEQRFEGRFHMGLMGLVLALDLALTATADYDGWSEAARNVVAFPLLILLGLSLLRIGQLGLAHVTANEPQSPEETLAYRDRLIRFESRAVQAVVVVGLVLGAVGYFGAARALIVPTVLTIWLLLLLVVLQKALVELYVLLIGSRENVREALFPVLAGFGLVLLSVPVLALIWGARVTDLTEVWSTISAGITLGETRISPAVFLTFAVIFVLGYLLTRLLQGALKSTILPKTRLDAGGRNAISAGVGYLGIFLSAVVAITSAGIDLSSLAIVAGALSVGIGFGLQTIVSNFVSGIILLIERPISEGDWIEVGGTHGIVRDISVRSTRIETFDRTDMIVPNADFVSGTVTNYTRGKTVGRLIVPVGVAYGSDAEKVDRVLREIAEAQPMALANPAPQVLFMGFGADSLDFEIRMILRDINWVLSVRNEVNHAIYKRFAEEGIEIPFAQRDVWLRNPEALVQAQTQSQPQGGNGAGQADPQGDEPPRRVEPPQAPPPAPREDAPEDGSDGDNR